MSLQKGSRRLYHSTVYSPINSRTFVRKSQFKTIWLDCVCPFHLRFVFRRIPVNSSSGNTYPSRSFIRFQAKLQIIADSTGEHVVSFIQHPGVYIDRPVFRYDEDQPDNGPSPTDRDLNTSYPSKPQPAKFKAAVQSIDALDVNETLLNEIASTTFQPNRHPELYRGYSTPEEAAIIEQHVAAELIATYERIIINRADEQIQQLNSLL